ncbi:MAG: ABC transporter permease [Candidatus Rokuibacteriota bacterium]|nr:MAG: ABC transporter permease [Candidatus Rokubacteria bacterium]
MRIWPIFKKEMRLYFTSPVAWVIMAVFLFIAGYFFYSIFSYYARVSMQSAMNPMGGGLNERRSGTIELLLTYPVRDGAVLLAKFLAAFTLYVLMIALTLLYPAIIWYFAPLEWGPILTGYAGLLLMGATFIAVGVFASSLTENQIVAALVSFLILLMFWVVGWSADFADPALARVLQHLSLTEHNESFAKGVFETKDVIFYVNFTLVALFLALRSLEARRWKG